MSRDEQELPTPSTDCGGHHASGEAARTPILKKPIDTFGPFRRVVLLVVRQSPVTQGVLAAFLFLTVSFACAWTCYATAMNAFRYSFDEQLLTLARVAAREIDPEAHAQLVDPEQMNGPEYLAIVQRLRPIVEACPDLRYIYTLRPSPEGLHFIVDSGLPVDTDNDGVIDQAPLGMIYRSHPPRLVEAMRAGETLVSSEPHTDLWGTFFSAWSPVRHDDGSLECLVGVDMSVEDFNAKHAAIWQSLLLAYIVAIFASTAVGGFVTISVRTRRDYLERLAESERRYELVLNSSNEGIWDWHLDEDQIFISEQIKTMLKKDISFSPTLSVLDRFVRLVHSDDRSRVQSAIKAHLERDVPYNVEMRLKAASGAYRWFQARGQVVRDDSGKPRQFVGSLADVHDRVQLRRQLRKAARIDRLTRLPNRSLLLSRLRRVIRRQQEHPGTHFALLFLDFDHFKIVNDSLGHDAGDTLLIAIASRLRENLRSKDGVLRASAASGTAARIGGDEFVVLLEGLRHPDDAVKVANRLLEVLSEPYQIQTFRVLSTASIGIVLGDDHYNSAEDLLRDADTAMYEAKASFRGSLAVFDETMRSRIRRRMQLEQGLRAAIAHDQLDLAYQPIVCLETGRIVSFEVLSRWVHPELGPISPEEFVPLAEECGLIVAMEERVIARSFRQLARWRDEAPVGARLPSLNVNLSRHHLIVPDLVARLLDATDAAGLSPSDIHLEITEGAMMQDVLTARNTIRNLRAVGFQLAIDDFGTGYSSLACLHEFPFDFLKIDPSFISGIGRSSSQTAILRTISSLAETLGFQVVAEGIETAEQLGMLRGLGCDFGQGFYFSRPIAADEIDLNDEFSFESRDPLPNDWVKIRS